MSVSFSVFLSTLGNFLYHKPGFFRLFQTTWKLNITLLQFTPTLANLLAKLPHHRIFTSVRLPLWAQSTYFVPKSQSINVAFKFITKIATRWFRESHLKLLSIYHEIRPTTKIPYPQKFSRVATDRRFHLAFYPSFQGFPAKKAPRDVPPWTRSARTARLPFIFSASSLSSGRPGRLV